jgi:hypothetical protein
VAPGKLYYVLICLIHYSISKLTKGRLS